MLEKALAQLGRHSSAHGYASLLRRCAESRSLADARLIHQHIVSQSQQQQRNLLANPILGTLLVQTYGKCGSIEEAKQAFDSLPHPDAFAFDSMVRAFTMKGHHPEAFALYSRMQQQKLPPNARTLAFLLKFCTSVEQGVELHASAREFSVDLNFLVANSIITMYARFRELHRARQVFDQLPKKELFTWNAMILGYTQCGYLEEALELYQGMDVVPDTVTLSCLLGACSALGKVEQGKQLHAKADSLEHKNDVVVHTSLVNFYGRCGEVDTAKLIFDGIRVKNVVTWNSMLAAFVANGCNEEAVTLYGKMANEGVKPSSTTFTSVVQACANLQDLAKGVLIHQQMLSTPQTCNVVVETALLSLYGKCNRLDAALELLHKNRDNRVTCNAMMAVYAQHGHWKEALELYRDNISRGIQPDSATYVVALSVCWSIDQLQDGREVHRSILKSHAGQDIRVQNALVSMYARCGSLEAAKSVFDRMQQRDCISWNAMIVAFVQHGEPREAMDTYERMVKQGVRGDAAAFSSIMFACSLMGDAEQGQRFHGLMKQDSNLHWDLDLHISVMNMYTDCGRLDLTREVFDQLLPVKHKDAFRPWHTIISAYAKHNKGKQALLLLKMMQLNGITPYGTTLSTVLGVCFDLKEGQALHKLVKEGGYQEDMVVQASLMTMYSRCGKVDVARQVFDRVKERNAVLWTGMISAYCQDNRPREALRLFYEMDVLPDDITYAVIFGTCTNLGALQEGMAIHEKLIFDGVQLGVVGTCGLVNMYAKCGKLDFARQLFDKLQARTHITWTTIIGAYVHHSRGREALELFKVMVAEGVPLDAVSFTAAFIACSQEGKLEVMREHFLYMLEDFDVAPMVEHYNCVIDLLGRAGWIKEAEELIHSMPFEPRLVDWTTLLGACTLHSDLAVAGRAAECAYELEPEDTSAYLLLSNICRDVGMEPQDVETLKRKLANKEFTAAAELTNYPSVN